MFSRMNDFNVHLNYSHLKILKFIKRLIPGNISSPKQRSASVRGLIKYLADSAKANFRAKCPFNLCESVVFTVQEFTVFYDPRLCLSLLARFNEFLGGLLMLFALEFRGVVFET